MNSSKKSSISQSAVHLPSLSQTRSPQQLSFQDKNGDTLHSRKFRIKTDAEIENRRFDTSDTLASKEQNYFNNSSSKASPNINASSPLPRTARPQLIEKEQISPQQVYSSSFKTNGARFSLNQSVNNSPAKIFMRCPRSSLDQASKALSERSHLYFTQSQAKGLNRYTQKAKQTEEEEEQLEDLATLRKLNESYEIELEDKKQKDLVGDEAIYNYYGHYKHLQKIIQQNIFFNVQPSLQTDILAEVEKRNLIPSKLGLIKADGEEDLLMLSHMQFGDQYAGILSFGLQKAASIKKYYLQHNRISENSSAQLISVVSKHAKLLNLATNNIGKIGCQNLSIQLQDNKCIIENLNLEDNKLGDYAILKLLEGISRNKSLRILNLSKNYISDRVCGELKNILDSNEIYELYLHWNLIKAQGGKDIFEGLKSNESLKVLDLSYNSLGKGNQKLSCAPQLCEYLSINTELKHIDLRNNSFEIQDSKDIAAALEKNKTIYGFHFQGNSGYVDNRGFLIVDEANQSDDLTAMHTKLRIDGCKVVEGSIFRTSRDKNLMDCCWICEGWVERKFTWTVGVSGEISQNPFFIHFNFEDFRGNFFGKDNLSSEEGKQTFTYNRVLPPGELEYFYSGEDSSEVAKDQEKKFNYEGNFIPDVQIYSGMVTDVPLKELNFLHIAASKRPFLKYEPLFRILPRTRDEVYIPPKQKKFRIKWTFPISLFAKWRTDDEELLRKCFDFDWEYGKIAKLAKKEEELNQIKEFFKSNYRLIKDCYKNYATKYPVGDIWAIQNPAFLEFIEKIKIIDRNLIKDPDINLKWVATISSIPQADKTNPRNPVQAISRYQMMEVLVRIAEEKYILKYKTTTNYFEAVKSFWDEHLAQEINAQYNLQTWRNERFWNEECDTCLKNYKRIVDHVYKKFSKLKVKPGQVPFMCLDEIQAICNKLGLLEEAHFGPNVALQAFNFSMMTQIDELQQDRIYQMSIVEFYEALGRIAEAASLQAIKSTTEVEEGEELQQPWTLEKRKAQPLGYKLEALLVRMLSHLCDASFKEKYPPIVKSFFAKDEDSDVELLSP